MASPLAPYINSRVLAVAEGAVSLVNGRYQAAQGDTYLIRCFMKEPNTPESHQALKRFH